jgi:replicative DNA helicase
MSGSTEPWQHTEQSLLGAVISDPASYWTVADMVTADDFGVASYGRIWKRVAELSIDGRKFDEITLCEDFRSDRQIGSVIIEVSSNSLGSANVVSYAERVVQNAEHRRVRAAGQQITKLGPGQSDEALRLLSDAVRSQGLGDQSMNDVMCGWHSWIESRMEAGQITGVRTGLRDLDAILCGFQRGDLVILAGRPSMGKSAFAGFITHSMAELGTPAATFSLEMSAVAFANRMMARESRVPLNDLRAPNQITDDGWARITAAMPKMQRLPIQFDETATVTGQQLCARIRKMVMRHKVQVVCIDYLQMITIGSGGKRGSQRHDLDIGDITRSLKLLAKELGITIIILSQLNRELERRADKRPILADLRDSGSIEQDADVVMFIYRDEYYVKDTDAKGITEVIIAKQREGSLGTVYLKSELNICSYSTTDYKPQQSAPDRPFKKRFAK